MDLTQHPRFPQLKSGASAKAAACVCSTRRPPPAGERVSHSSNSSDLDRPLEVCFEKTTIGMRLVNFCKLCLTLLGSPGGVDPLSP